MDVKMLTINDEEVELRDLDDEEEAVAPAPEVERPSNEKEVDPVESFE